MIIYGRLEREIYKWDGIDNNNTAIPKDHFEGNDGDYRRCGMFGEIPDEPLKRNYSRRALQMPAK